MFSNMKIPNVRNFFFEKGAAKKNNFFIFLKGRHFVKGGSIDMNVDMF